MDQGSMLDLQNRENRNRWYQVEKVSDRELIIRFPKDDPTTARVLDGHFRFVLMDANVFDEWKERALGASQVGFMAGIIVGVMVGYMLSTLH